MNIEIYYCVVVHDDQGTYCSNMRERERECMHSSVCVWMYTSRKTYYYLKMLERIYRMVISTYYIILSIIINYY